MLIVESNFPYLAAFAIGLVGAAVLGVSSEFLVIRRFSPKPKTHLNCGYVGPSSGAGPLCSAHAGLVGQCSNVAEDRFSTKHPIRLRQIPIQRQPRHRHDRDSTRLDCWSDISCTAPVSA